MSYAEIIASIMLFGSGLLTVERGLFWIVETDESMVDSNLYKTLSYVMPLWSWGLVFAIGDRKSTRLNSSHVAISYAVFCLKKKKQETGEQCLADIQTRDRY